MMRTRWLRLLALLLALGLLAAACGDSDDDGGDTDGTEAPAEDTEATAGTEAPADDTEGGDDVSGAALPTEGQVEIAPGTVLDLDECPDDWSPTFGADGDTITLGISLPQSGQVAAFGAIAEGMQAYFDWVNENDPVDGKQIELIARDDAYEAGRTVANIEEMLETEEIFAFTYIIGTPNNAAVRPILDEACIPQLFNSTGFPAWGDPADFPWTIGGLLSYETEATLWCENVVAELGEGATVAGLFMNNDFGTAYQDAVEGCADDGLIDLVANEVHEATAPDITNEMTNMIASEADVFMFGSTAAFCPQSVGALAQSDWRPVFYMSNTCSNLASFFAPVQDAAALLASEGSGVRQAAYAKNFTDPTYVDDASIVQGNEILEDAGLSADEGSYSTGVYFAYNVEQVLRGALEYGGMNRVALMASVWTSDFENPFLYDGLTVRSAGTDDSYLIEAARLEEVVVDDDGNLTFSPISELISVEGETGTFAG